MKKLLYVVLLLPSFLLAQTTTENYIVKKVYKTKRTTVSGLSTIPSDSVTKAVSYFDGLGRIKQNVVVRAGGNLQDIITHYQYDSIGRQTKDFLPYTELTNNGDYRTGDIGLETQTYYLNKYPNDFLNTTTVNVNAYSEKLYDDSPLNRVLKQGAPGKDWKASLGQYSYYDHGIEFDYQVNSSSEVFIYGVSLSLTNIPTLTGGTSYYDVGYLYKSIIRDENHTGYASSKNHTTEEFKNKNGQVVLKRTYANVSGVSAAHDTYYVYDNFGNLTYVLPPKANETTIDTTILNDLCYQYIYDQRNRLIEKKIPGKGWEYIVYDNLDRPVLTQDANQRVPSTDEWLFTKYDLLGRVVYTGIYDSNSTRLSLQSTFDAKIATSNYETKSISSDNLGIYYSNSDFPNTSIEVLTVSYYDNYTFDLAGSGTAATITPTYGVLTTNTKGLATGAKVRVLGTSDWITTVSFYDDKARPIYVYSYNDYLKTTDIIESDLDFIGKVDETTTTHTNTNGNHSTQTIKDTFEYDHAGRLEIQKQYLNGSSSYEVLVNNTYDELGQLITKKVGNNLSTPLQTVDYTYNVRGWLTSINDPNNIGTDLFSFKINYNTTDMSSSTALYNGNISETIWKTANDVQSQSSYFNRGYSYEYDALNRIIKGAFEIKLSTGSYGAQNYGNYDLKSVNYDKNGNILFLDRASTFYGAEMDKLSYTYDSGNKLLKVVDDGSTYNNLKDDGFKDGTNTGNDYTYDDNGNMLTDANKGITSITYNHLNLPTQVYFSSGKFIDYIYDATGTKLEKQVRNLNSLTTTSYAGNYIYKNNNLQFFNTAEGYFNVTSTSGTVSGDYVYQYKDHLGNIRLSYSDGNNNGIIETSIYYSEIIEESNYYPFGLKHKGYNNVINGTHHPYGYGGKEENDELGLNWLDFGARNYDASLGRWMNLDPLAEKSHDWSPYNSVFDNPILFVDPDGEYPIITITNQQTGNTVKQRVIGNYNGGWQYTNVNTYKVVVTDSEDSNFRMEFAVARDAFAVKSGNDNGGTMTMSNVSFEPKDGNVNHYTGKYMDAYPKGNDTPAIKLTQRGSEVMHAEARPDAVDLGYRNKKDVAAGVMIHVGGNYENEKTGSSISASEGCFGVCNKGNSASNTSDQLTNSIMKAIKIQADKSKTAPGHIRIIIQKRDEKNIPDNVTHTKN